MNREHDDITNARSAAALRLARRLEDRADHLNRTRTLSPIEVVELIEDLRTVVMFIRYDHEPTRTSAVEAWRRSTQG